MNSVVFLLRVKEDCQLMSFQELQATTAGLPITHHTQGEAPLEVFPDSFKVKQEKTNKQTKPKDTYFKKETAVWKKGVFMVTKKKCFVLHMQVSLH